MSDLNAISAAKLPSIPCGKRHIYRLTAATTFRSWHTQNVLGAATGIHLPERMAPEAMQKRG